MKNPKLIHKTQEELNKDAILDLYGDDPDRKAIVKKIKESEVVFGRICELINAMNRSKISYEIHPHPLVGGLWITYPAGNNPIYSIIATKVMDNDATISDRASVEFCDLSNSERIDYISPEEALRRMKRHRDSFYAEQRRNAKNTGKEVNK